MRRRCRAANACSYSNRRCADSNASLAFAAGLMAPRGGMKSPSVFGLGWARSAANCHGSWPTSGSSEVLPFKGASENPGVRAQGFESSSPPPGRSKPSTPRPQPQRLVEVRRPLMARTPHTPMQSNGILRLGRSVVRRPSIEDRACGTSFTCLKRHSRPVLEKYVHRPVRWYSGQRGTPPLPG